MRLATKLISLIKLTGAVVKQDHHFDGLLLRPKHQVDFGNQL
ncbi:hypothetical protein [Psychrobacillus vulpis]|nr:hypothetical protein [Psychrobacillus vulpis]